MKIPVTDIKVKRRINPRFELDSDYIDELVHTDHWPAVIVTRKMILADGFHRLEAAKKRGDEAIEVDIRDISEEEALALVARLNTTHGKGLTVLELAERIRILTEEQGWSHRRAGRYFNKDHAWITHRVNIANNLNTTLVLRNTTLTYCSARELAKLPQPKQAEAYRLARKMAMHDRRPSPSARLVAKVVKKIRNEPLMETD